MSFLQIASWNIEHLGGDKRKDKAQSAFALADHIEMAGVDIIALQELYTTPVGDEVILWPDSTKPVKVKNSATTDRRSADLDRVCHLLHEHLGQTWRYLILPNRDETDTEQLCGVMWNENRVRQTDLMAVKVPEKVGWDWIWDRTPHAVKFSATIGKWVDGTEVDVTKSVVIVPLHMKSNYTKKGGNPAANPRKRAKEAETLCEQLEEIRKMDPSIILIGDTNVRDRNEKAIEVFADNGLIDLNDKDEPTFWSPAYPNGSPFDRAFVAEERDEFVYSRQYILRSANASEHDRYLSDHFMIKMSVKIYVDDDDPRD